MTMNANRRRVHDKLAGLPGVRPVRRPVSPGSADEFDLYYVRTGRRTAHPVVIIPGGPGVASVRMYKGMRRRAVAAGLDVIMIEHRGVGMSRHDDSGADLPPEALTVDQVVDDVAAVLDDAHVDKAVISGTSYGTYIAAGVGVRHPGRVQAMILDSPLLSRHDIELVRGAIRGLLLEGDNPEAAQLVTKVRQLVEAGVMTAAGGQIATRIYGYGGLPLLDRQLDLLLDGRTILWRGLLRVSSLLTRPVPYRFETDLVRRIAFRELDYASQPDGLPLDPAVAIREVFPEMPTFESEPYDLIAEMPKFDWPTAVLSGGRDLVTPPAVAQLIASLVPHAVLVPLPTAAHGVLDDREEAALAIAAAVSHGEFGWLADQAPTLDALPASTLFRLLSKAIEVAITTERFLATVSPRQRRFSSA
jgi:proline iminopeptidase